MTAAIFPFDCRCTHSTSAHYRVGRDYTVYRADGDVWIANDYGFPDRADLVLVDKLARFTVLPTVKEGIVAWLRRRFA